MFNSAKNQKLEILSELLRLQKYFCLERAAKRPPGHQVKVREFAARPNPDYCKRFPCSGTVLRTKIVELHSGILKFFSSGPV